MRSLFHQVLLTPAHANLRYRGAIVLYLLILSLGSIPGARADMGRVASGLVLHSCAYAAPLWPSGMRTSSWRYLASPSSNSWVTSDITACRCD